MPIILMISIASARLKEKVTPAKQVPPSKK